jgi:hypothetical protein
VQPLVQIGEELLLFTGADVEERIVRAGLLQQGKVLLLVRRARIGITNVNSGCSTEYPFGKA